MVAAEIAKLRNGQRTPDLVFRDPYFLELLGLRGAFSERDLEGAILRELEGVLLELGSGLCGVPSCAGRTCSGRISPMPIWRESLPGMLATRWGNEVQGLATSRVAVASQSFSTTCAVSRGGSDVALAIRAARWTSPSARSILLVKGSPCRCS